MSWLTRFPIFWFASCLIIGIIAYQSLGFALGLSLSSVSLLLLFAFLWFANNKLFIPYTVLGGIAVLSGVWLSFAKEFEEPKKANLPIIAYTAIVDAEVQHTLKWQKTVLITQKVLYTDGRWADFQTKIQFYFPNDSIQLSYGNELLVKGSPQMADTIRFPWQFDYKGYLARKGIFYFQYAKEVKLGQTNFPNKFLGYALSARKWAETTLTELISNTRTRAVAVALILGNKDLLTPDISQSFARVGALHALAVSGAHLIILFEIIMKLIAKVAYNKKGNLKLIVGLLLLIAIWAYAFITGWSASILRAAIMFSFVIIGKMSNTKIPTLNSIGASAFLLILINPLTIYDIGFQLSYLAVLGIIFIATPLSAKFKFKNYVTQKSWDITLIALAANAGTLLLSAYYFHFVPTYFLLANLFVIPLTEVALGIGIIVLAFSWVSFINTFLAYILSKVLSLNEALLLTINHLPDINIEHFELTITQLFIGYLVLILTYCAFITRKIKYLFLSLALVSLVIIGQVTVSFNSTASNELALLFYNQKILSVLEKDLSTKTFEPKDYLPKNSADKISLAIGVSVQKTNGIQILKFSSNAAWTKASFEHLPQPKFIWINGFVPYKLGKYKAIKNCTLLVSPANEYQLQKLKQMADTLPQKLIILRSPMRIPS